MITLKELQDDVITWADGISPERSPKDAVVKMVAETSELLDAVLNKDRMAVEGELGDCLILLLDIAKMYDVDLVKAGDMKMTINWNRKWESVNGVIRRKRNGGQL